MRSFIDTIAQLSVRALPLLTLLAIPLGFLFLEFPANMWLADMDPFYLRINLFIAAAVFLVIYGIGQRSRVSIIVYLTICLMAGIANYFVISFKGQPITPADLSALSTAAAVSGGYDYVLNVQSIICIALFAGMCAALMIQPAPKPTYRAPTAALNLTCAAAVVLGLVSWFQTTDISERYYVSIDVWSQKESYAEQGSALCFLKRMQDITPQEPVGYDHSTISELIDAFDPVQLNTEPVEQAAFAGSDGVASVPDDAAGDLPTIIVIMNETFADLSSYPGLEDSAAVPIAFRRIAAESIAAGDAYVSAFGGGTCNSEFEFLTGSSMGHMGGGVYPYTMYDLGHVESLVSHLANLGYNTHAIHPKSPTNWSRNRVYAQLGFSDFTTKAAFEGAETLRDMVTDRATYDHILQTMEGAQGPQFFFDVTMQNHGGYDTGLIPEADLVSIAMPDGEPFAELNEYASCIQRSDTDLAYLVEQLEQTDHPVYVCFFGDHQPGFADTLFERTHDGVGADSIGIDAAQERYRVPYLIWGNAQARERSATLGWDRATASTVSSLNYLGSQLCVAAGIPLSSYQRFLLSTSQTIPAINLNGFLDANGTWQGYGWDVDEQTEAVLVAYGCVQYDNLFVRDKGIAEPAALSS